MCGGVEGVVMEITQGEGKVRRRVLRAVPRRKAVVALKKGRVASFSWREMLAMSWGAGEMGMWVGMDISSVAILGGGVGGGSRDDGVNLVGRVVCR